MAAFPTADAAFDWVEAQPLDQDLSEIFQAIAIAQGVDVAECAIALGCECPYGLIGYLFEPALD